MAKPILPTEPLEGADAERMAAALGEREQHPDEIARRAERARDFLARLRKPKPVPAQRALGH